MRELKKPLKRGLALFIFSLVSLSTLLASDKSFCQIELRKILESTKLMGPDWAYCSLLELETLCPHEREISYWKAVVLLDLFQYQKASFEVALLKKKIKTLEESHWLHLWVFIREKELEFLQNKIQAEDYKKEVLKKTSKVSVVSFLESSLRRKPPFSQMKDENQSSSVYKELQIFEENSDDKTKKMLRRDLNEITSSIPLLANLLKKITLILASDEKQFQKWMGQKNDASVLGSSPEWAQREFVIVANNKALLANNITLLHELLHIFVRTSPELHETILKFRHNFAHYKNPKADSEHFFVNASQFYLSSYDLLYKKRWAKMHKLLKKVWGEARVPARGTIETQVLWRINEDQRNFLSPKI